MKKVKITEIKEVAEGSFLLSFKRDFEFKPGQVIGVNIGNTEPDRLYSIASGFRDEMIRILFTIKDDGYLTPQLAKYKPGDSILVSEPFGNFVCNEKEAYWIASGTGIAPFASMTFSWMAEGKTLIHGSRFLSNFYFQDELKSLLKNCYIRCCTAESSEGIYSGRLTDFLKEQPGLPKDKKYFICGSAEMVVDTRDILINKGIPYENIIAEIYF
jgi:ferredoxin--NADP+ reductase